MKLGLIALTGVFALTVCACSTPAAQSVVDSVESTSASRTAVAPPAASASAAPAAPMGFAIQTQSRTDLQNYSEFSYMSATTTGLTPEAAAIADERIKGMVDAAVSAAVADDDGECLEGETKCGYFEQSLKPLPCRDGYLCLEQHVNAAPVGLAISDEQVAVLVLDPQTGRKVNLGDVVKETDREAFLAAVNDSVVSVQESEGVYDPNDAPDFSEADFAAWAPLPDGIHVWFPKYMAGPGSIGAVEVTVPTKDGSPAQSSTRAASTWKSLKDVGTVPVYVILKAYEAMPDGSTLLTVDPLSPDIDAAAGTACAQVPYQKPDGSYCLLNNTVRDRQVTLKPDAGVFVGDSTTSFESLVDYLSRVTANVYVFLDKRGYASEIGAFESWIPDDTSPNAGSGNQGETTPPPPQSVSVPNVVGTDPDSAGRVLSAAGLTYSVQPAGGVSVAQQARGGCIVISQNPRGGLAVRSGTFVSATFDCPAIPMPAAPQPYTGADSGQYNGPAPPPAWTGR